MVKHGGLELAMTEAVWEHTFKELEEQAKELLNKCEQCLGTLIIRSCE